MPLCNLSSLSLAYPSSLRSRLRPPSIPVFSLLQYDSSYHRPPPPTGSIAPRLIHSLSQPQRPGTKMKQMTDVSLSISKQLLRDEGEYKNVVFSPLSIQVLLSVMAAGSSGPTLEQLLTFLKSKSVDGLNRSASQITSYIFADGSHCRLSFACGAWVDQSLSVQPSFNHLFHTTYKATLQQCDFRTKADEVVPEVNSWVEKHTNGRIANILSPGSVRSDTDVILANALYFKGGWIRKFKSSQTKPQNFYLRDGSSVEVPFMTSKEKQCIAAFDGFKVLQMAYEYCGFEDERGFSMFIFLPDARDGLPSLIEKLDSRFIDRHLPRKQVKVGEFKIPKFKFSFGVEVSEMLKRMGLVSPFMAGEGNFSKVVDCHSQIDNGFVSNILHKAYIEVNEEGTEAAAATTVTRLGCSRMSPKLDVIDFVADHPFLFAIMEETTRTLPFVGQVLNPNIKF